MSRFLRYLLLAIFVAVIFLIVFLQFNSNRNIDRLISGNENLLVDFAVKTNLQRLQTEIAVLESKLRGTVIGGAASSSETLGVEISAIKNALHKLDTLARQPNIRPLLASLNNLVDAKIKWNESVLDTFKTKGKLPAEKIINTAYGRKLTDSIKTLCSQVDELHQLTVSSLIEQADSNGNKAKTQGTIMAAIAVVASLFTFIFVAIKVRQQQQLIARLDSSEKKAKEAAVVKENFLANMSHEIRTPLNAILGFTNLLQRKELDAESKTHIQTIQRSGENLLAIVNDVLDLSKIEAGMMRIEAAPFGIRELVHSIEVMFRQKAAEKHLQLVFSIAENVPDHLEGDATRLTQILVNLVGNAIKFTPTGTVSVNISNARTIENRVYLRFIVSDTGIGIEDEKLKTIFERFQQGEDAVTRKYGGSGLGLSIVRELVVLQDGTLNIESTLGAGTTFTIELPYIISSGKITGKANQPVKSVADHDFTGTSILVAEDNEINQNLLKHLFDRWQIIYQVAANGIEAIEMLKQRSYDLILMDIQMPGMDGYTATQEIRKTLFLDTPVIAMTAHALRGEKEKCLSYGMNDYISKPIREQELIRIISKFTHKENNLGKTGENHTVQQTSPYQFINLQYMKEISMGNTEYEKTVTEQFLEMVPGSLKSLKYYWQQRNLPELRQAAHNMKTTVSVMGLTGILQPYLNTLENQPLDDNTFDQIYRSIEIICLNACSEAEQFYATL